VKAAQVLQFGPPRLQAYTAGYEHDLDLIPHLATGRMTVVSHSAQTVFLAGMELRLLTIPTRERESVLNGTRRMYRETDLRVLTVLVAAAPCSCCSTLWFAIRPVEIHKIQPAFEAA